MVDVRGFIGQQADYGGLFKAADTVMHNKELEQVNQFKRDQRQAQTTSELNRFFDPKDFLTGSPYDPMLVKQIEAALQKGYQLTSQGMSNSGVFMALGPDVARINEYSQKAKLINKNIDLATEARKQLGGYNAPAIKEGTRKEIFFNKDGSPKDIKDIDPNKDYVSEYIDKNPYEATTDEGFKELFKSIKPQERQIKAKVSKGGSVVDESLTSSLYPWQSPKRDAKGHVMTDANGEPMIDIEGDTHTGADGKGYRLLNKDYVQSIFKNNPDIHTRVRGLVMNDFKQAGGEIPDENSEEWQLHERKVTGDMLSQFGGGSLKRVKTSDDGVRKYKPTEEKKPTTGLLNRPKRY